MLWQYQCRKEGTLFYYQCGGTNPPLSYIVERCPVCSSRKIRLIRGFPDIDEHSEEAREKVTGKPALLGEGA